MSDERRTAEIAAGLAAVRERIEAAARASGRNDGIDLVVVTKTFPASDVVILAELGVTDVAENRHQEAAAKRQEAGELGLRWHMIGQLQRNKAAAACRWADVVESVDRVELLLPLSRGAQDAGAIVDVLVQVSLDPDGREDRGGVNPARATDLAQLVTEHDGLRLAGVMGVAPWPGDPDEAFARLHAVAQQVRQGWPEARIISAGMSGDLEQAVAHGATQVRVGGAILGQRAAVQ